VNGIYIIYIYSFFNATNKCVFSWHLSSMWHDWLVLNGFDMGFVSYLSLNKSAVGIFPKSC